MERERVRDLVGEDEPRERCVTRGLDDLTETGIGQWYSNAAIRFEVHLDGLVADDLGQP